MAEAITIPSPSVFLRPRSPSPPAASQQPNAPKHARRQNSLETKKKAPRKAGGAMSNAAADGNVAKPKQSKSRNGCVTCKAKRLKCGEEKPGCQQCARRTVECGGYKKDFKWRPFEETNVKIHIDRQKRGNSPKQTSAESSKRSTPNADISPKKTNPEIERRDEARNKRDSVLNEDAPSQEHAPQKSPASKKKQKSPSVGREPVSPVEEEPEPEPHHLIVDQTPSTYASSNAISPELLHPGSLSHLTPGLGLSPTLTEILLPFDGNNPEHQDFVHYQLPEGFQTPLSLDDMIDPSLEDADMGDDGIDQIERSVETMSDLPMALRTRHRSPSLNSTGSPGNVLSAPVSYIYPQPYFAEDSPEMLTFRFDRMTCGILSIMDGPHENPWRNLVWPLAQASPALYHAITAMTAFHSASDIPQLRVVGHEHKAASIRFIQEGIRDASMDDQTAIATALALGFAESWDQHTTTGNTHIKGAQVLVRRALRAHRRNPLEGDELARLKFLCNAWVYMDVIARLTSVDSDESNDFDNTFVFSGNPNEAPPMVMGDTDPGFGIDFGMPIDARLDPQMGCANTLFPLVGRVANLIRKVCRSQVNSPAIISQANDLKIALEGWDPPAFIERPEDPTTDVQHTLQTAEAYRWATLLHLHSSVPELPSLSSPELAQRVLQYLATVPLASRTVVVQIYPLMVAGCEAKTAEDRQWVRLRWIAMSNRMRIGLLEKCATVTEEVWRRRDQYEAQPASNRKLVATAELQPSRQRGQPLVRTSTGSIRLGDPGRTGMVFSFVESENDPNSADEDEQKHRARERRNGRDPRMGVMDPAYTVRGHLHWVGVMWDWGWEILLG
ncbi:hypothetical protein LTR37_008299 [Vermiconidia calcicola]|uniref:Uncharacterized protein n=1 Tax=Vermiconidia calcicola TaxID=1690605 RepID=A0ACC3NBE0_9PEZI|nr:hypothetical protein LTR37_008299 [Vermiconidia calcicola]